MATDQQPEGQLDCTSQRHVVHRDAVLVVIPVLNEAAHIEVVLSQLSLGLPENTPVHLVVVDGGSCDGTREIVSRLARSDTKITALHNPKRLQSAAVNQAVRTLGASFSILVRCDAHSIYPAGFISNLIQTLNLTQADAVVVPMDSRGDTCLRKAIAWISDTVVGSGGAAHRGGTHSGYVDHGHHAAFRMRTFAAAGGYDESFSHNEDAEFDCRQRALGARIYFDANIRIGYVPRGTLSSLWAQYFAYGVGRSRTVRKHRRSLRIRQFAVPANVIVLFLCLLAAPWHPLLIAWPGLYVGALSLTAGLLTVRHRDTCGFLAAPAALTMHVAWAFGFLSGMIFQRQARWSGSSLSPLILSDASLPDPPGI
jgi:succinoglycan biosynthesis protein ExoA